MKIDVRAGGLFSGASRSKDKAMMKEGGKVIIDELLHESTIPQNDV